MKTPYEILGVPRNADDTAIRAALTKAAKTYHPDINGRDLEAEQKLKHVIAAYKMLRDTRQRAAFDRAWRRRRRRKIRSLAATALMSGALASGLSLMLIDRWAAPTQGRRPPPIAIAHPWPEESPARPPAHAILSAESVVQASHDGSAPEQINAAFLEELERRGDDWAGPLKQRGAKADDAKAQKQYALAAETDGARRVLAVSHQFAEASDVSDRALRVFAAELRQRVPDLKIAPGPMPSPALDREQQFQALQDGTLDLAVFPLVEASKRIPEFALGLLPGLVPSPKAAAALEGSEVHRRLQEIAEAHGVRILTWWWMSGGFVSRSGIVADPDTLVGLRVRAGGGNFEALVKAAGARPVALPPSGLAEALRSGEADVVLASCEDFLSLRLHEHARFATFGGNSLWTDFTPLLVSKKVWDSLTPQERAAMEAAAEASNRYFAAAELEAEKRALAALEQAGVRVRQMSSEEYLGWVALAQRTSWAQYANASPASRALLTAAVRTLLQNRTAARLSPVPQDAAK